MGNCSTIESSELKTNIILYDEGTCKEYPVRLANQKSTVWSTVIEECTKQNRTVRKINFGGTAVSNTMTWEQLDISDDATVIVDTTKVP